MCGYCLCSAWRTNNDEHINGFYLWAKILHWRYENTLYDRLPFSTSNFRRIWHNIEIIRWSLLPIIWMTMDKPKMPSKKNTQNKNNYLNGIQFNVLCVNVCVNICRKSNFTFCPVESANRREIETVKKIWYEILVLENFSQKTVTEDICPSVLRFWSKIKIKSKKKYWICKALPVSTLPSNE